MIEAIGITCVKNEADVIEAFVRHNLAYLDALFVIENDSVDRTREILVELRKEGLPIVLFDDPIVGHFQKEKMTAIYRRLVPKFKPRFVFLLDADEFIVAQSREALYSQLRTMRPGSQAKYYWRTYVPAPTHADCDGSDPLRSITHRRASEERSPKSIIVASPKIDLKLKIEQGNHNVKLMGRSLPAVDLQDVVLAHFPVRSVDQLTGKALVGWITNMERYRHRRRSTFGFQKKLLYQRILREGGLTAKDLTEEALKYAQFSPHGSEWPDDVVYDPVSPNYAPLTAQSGEVCTPLLKVVRCVDKILNPDADLSDIEKAERSLSSHSSGRWLMRKNRLYADLPPFRYLVERDRPQSVLEIGCGAGAYLKYIAALGATTIKGVDSTDGRFGYLKRDEYLRLDPGEHFALPTTFDLVLCTEVIGRVPPESENVLIDNVVRHAGGHIVFSGPRPGQTGSDQLNRQPISHWLELFAAAGWYPALFDTLALRSLSTFPWLRNNLVVFTRDSVGADEARARLVVLEADGLEWTRQRPEVVAHPFTEMAGQLSSSGKSRWLSKISL